MKFDKKDTLYMPNENLFYPNLFLKQKMVS